MTPERIAELRALADAATDGPWVWVDSYRLEGPRPEGHQYEFLVMGNSYNRQFIAAARAAIPELLDEVERLRAERDEWVQIAKTPSMFKHVLAESPELTSLRAEVERLRGVFVTLAAEYRAVGNINSSGFDVGDAIVAALDNRPGWWNTP